MVTVCVLSPGTPHDSRDDGRDTDRSASGSRSQLNTLRRAVFGIIAEREREKVTNYKYKLIKRF